MMGEMTENDFGLYTLKVGEIRERYERGEVNVIEVMTPRSEKEIHSPSRMKDDFGNDNPENVSMEKVLWDLDANERIQFLTGSTGDRTLLVKNVKCYIEELVE